MYRNIAVAILALSLGGSFALNAPSASAQTVDPAKEKKPAAKRGPGARTGAPHPARTVRPPAARTARPPAGRAVTPRPGLSVAPRVGAARTVTAGRLRGVPVRGAGRAFVRGAPYSAWRSGYRVRHNNRWRTFVALGTLGAILIGPTRYYPYAYISAPQRYCEGYTEDGCELEWMEAETLEGDIFDQCVAYCPWQ